MSFKIYGDDNPISWSIFQSCANQLIEKNKTQRSKTPLYYSDWVFRGQSQQSWMLATSLERYIKNELNLEDKKFYLEEYYRAAHSVLPAVNSLTGNNFPDIEDIDEKDFSKFGYFKQPSFHYFLRHNGFPSPLMDWSYSYYVAAFFAFSAATNSDDVSIYAYREYCGESKSGIVGRPIIETQGPYIETHHRHFSQQSTYTVCYASEVKNGERKVYFAKHEDAVLTESSSDHMIKFILSKNEKDKVLESLYYMNINDYSLFRTDESLLKSEAFLNFKLGGRR